MKIQANKLSELAYNKNLVFSEAGMTTYEIYELIWGYDEKPSQMLIEYVDEFLKVAKEEEGKTVEEIIEQVERRNPRFGLVEVIRGEEEQEEQIEAEYFGFEEEEHGRNDLENFYEVNFSTENKNGLEEKLEENYEDPCQENLLKIQDREGIATFEEKISFKNYEDESDSETEDEDEDEDDIHQIILKKIRRDSSSALQNSSKPKNSYKTFPRNLLYELYLEKDILDIEFNYFSKYSDFEAAKINQIEKHLLKYTKLCGEFNGDFNKIYEKFIDYLDNNKFEDFEINYDYESCLDENQTSNERENENYQKNYEEEEKEKDFSIEEDEEENYENEHFQCKPKFKMSNGSDYYSDLSSNYSFKSEDHSNNKNKNSTRQERRKKKFLTARNFRKEKNQKSKEEEKDLRQLNTLLKNMKNKKNFTVERKESQIVIKIKL